MFQIIKARQSDLPQLRQLAIETFTDTFASLNDPTDFERYLQENFNETVFESELQNPDSLFFIALKGLRLVGYFKINTNNAQTENQGSEAVELQRLYILPEYKGQNIGKQLIERAEAEGRALGKKHIWLGVWEKNLNALAFYEKMGYTVFDSHVFIMGSDHQKDLLMKKKLD